MTTAQKSAINATHTATLSNLADDLIGRNASEALDDPIAIAAAGNAAAAANKAAWETVRNLQARAAITFAGTGPGAGGFAMGFAGFTGWVGDQFDVVWAGIAGAGQGLAAAIDGFIPFFDPFEEIYANPDGSISLTFRASRFLGNISRDLLLFAASGAVTNVIVARAGLQAQATMLDNLIIGRIWFSELIAMNVPQMSLAYQVTSKVYTVAEVYGWYETYLEGSELSSLLF